MNDNILTAVNKKFEEVRILRCDVNDGNEKRRKGTQCWNHRIFHVAESGNG